MTDPHFRRVRKLLYLSSMPGSYDVFLALHPFRGSVREFQILVRPLADLDAGLLQGVEGFYSHALDLALVALRFHRPVVIEMGAPLIHSLVKRSGLPMVLLDELTPEARRGFLFKYLSGCTTYVQQYLTETEPVPVVERLVLNLAGHVESIALAPTMRRFDVESELPIARDGARRAPARLGTAG